MNIKPEKWQAKECVQYQQGYGKTIPDSNNNNISAIENLNIKADGMEKNKLATKKSSTFHYDEFIDNNFYNNRSTKFSMSHNDSVLHLGQQNSDLNTNFNERNNTSRFLQFFGKTNTSNKSSGYVNGGAQYYSTSTFQPQARKNVSSNCLDEFFRQALLNSQCKFKKKNLSKLKSFRLNYRLLFV